MTHEWMFDAELWRWDGPAAWIFVSVPDDIADEIADIADAMPRAGFGSVRVYVTIGTSRWTTSVFPDKSRGTYLLPVKKAVRAAQGIDEGDLASVTLELADA
jgi:hypothetical protein